MAQQKAKAAAGKSAVQSAKGKKSGKAPYEPPRLTKFDKLEKLIVCGE